MNNALLHISSRRKLKSREVLSTPIGASNHPTHDLRHDIRKIIQLRCAALAFTILLYPGFALATTQIDSLFEQFDELATILPQDLQTPAIVQDVSTQEVAPQTEFSCALTIGEAQQKIDDLSRQKRPIEKRVTDLNDRHSSILDKMPIVGAATKGACTSRVQRDIEDFRSDVADLNLEALKQPVDDMFSCIMNFRQENSEQERQLKASKIRSNAAKIKLNNRTKVVTDMDTKRNDFAIFLGQIEGFLERRLYEISESEQINC